MFIGALAGGNRVPENRRDDRVQRGNPAAGPSLHEALERGQITLVKQRVDDLPIRRIPAQENDAFSET